MAGKFSIKRRKQAALRPDGQSSQGGVLAALGIGVGRSSPHVASKRGHVHVSDPAADPVLARAEAQRWAASTGRPLPPHLRFRRPLQPPAALDVRGRITGYLARDVPHLGALLDPLSTADLLDSPLLTTAQRRRLLHKAGSHGERPAGFEPAAARPAHPPAPRTPAQRARQRKDAAQRRRRLDRYWREHPLSPAEQAALDDGQPVLSPGQP